MTAVLLPPELPAGTSATRGFWSQFFATALGTLAGLVAAAGTMAVVTAGFTLSFDAIRRVAIASYIRHDWAWLMPVAVDGSMAVATVTAIVMRRLGRSARYPWLVVFVGAAISILCNAAHASTKGGTLRLPEIAAMAVSAIPALNLALSVHLLVMLALTVAQRQEHQVPATTAAQIPAVMPTQPPVYIPPQVPPQAHAEAPAEARPELQAEDPAELRPAPRRRPSSARSRKKTTRRSAAETRQLAEELQIQFPRATKAEIAGKLGISDRALRQALNVATANAAAE